jgi:hypothetical protein
MAKRAPYALLLAAALLAWWVGDHYLVPWVQDFTHYRAIQSRALSLLLGHWVIDQGPRLLLCLAVWRVGFHFGLLPSLSASLGSGGSWRRVLRTGLVATVAFLAVSAALVLATSGTFGVHPYFPKMAGDLVSNMYEEIVYRGLMFSACYGLAAAAPFPLTGPTQRAGLVVGTLCSCLIFGVAHEQYAVALRVVVGLVAILFVYPWASARSLWAAWLPHTVGDIIDDTFMAL